MMVKMIGILNIQIPIHRTYNNSKYFNEKIGVNFDLSGDIKR